MVNDCLKLQSTLEVALQGQLFLLDMAASVSKVLQWVPAATGFVKDVVMAGSDA